MVQSASVTSPPKWRRITSRIGLMALLWLGLTGSDWSSWLVGLPVVLAATWVSLWLHAGSSWKWSLSGIIPFAWYFTRQSISGGWDVARRAFGPKGNLNPGFVSYRLWLPSTTARLFFCGIVSLLPGSLVVSLSDRTAAIHLLEISTEVEADLAVLERHVARLFALQLPSETEGA